MSRAGFRNASLYKGAGVEFVGGATIISSGRQPDLRSGTRPRVARCFQTKAPSTTDIDLLALLDHVSPHSGVHSLDVPATISRMSGEYLRIRT